MTLVLQSEGFKVRYLPVLEKNKFTKVILTNYQHSTFIIIMTGEQNYSEYLVFSVKIPFTS